MRWLISQRKFTRGATGRHQRRACESASRCSARDTTYSFPSSTRTAHAVGANRGTPTRLGRLLHRAIGAEWLGKVLESFNDAFA
eukprot:1105265-Prymnesium_polylepis.1